MAKNYPGLTKRGIVSSAKYTSMASESWDKHGSSKGRGTVVPFNGTQGKNKRPID